MRREIERAKEEASGVRMYLLAAYYLMMANFLGTIVTLGIITIVLGATVVEAVHKVFAGMFGVWGATMVAFGVVSYAFLWFMKLRSRRRSATS